jgi:hypothetical protein
MAANPVAQDDRAYYTPINTDLVVTTFLHLRILP